MNSVKLGNCSIEKLESWESVQGNPSFPLFARGTFSSTCGYVARTKTFTAEPEPSHGCLRVGGVARETM